MTDAERDRIAETILSRTRAFEHAERSRDAERTISFMAPDFFMYNDGIRIRYDSIAASIRRTMSAFKYFEPGFDNVEVRVLGPDAAVVAFTFRDSIVTMSDQIMRFTGPTTLVWERRDGDWLIVYADADHYPVSP